ncbi:MAG: glycosyltransferase family A protein [Planctomycetota bacterium]
MSGRPRLVIISPCRNEQMFASTTIKSVLAQTFRPHKWLIVDDGSSDATPAILRDFAKKDEMIRIVRRDDRGHRQVGPGVVDAFYAGYDRIVGEEWDYVCKLDLDLELPPRYFETLIERMEQEPRLGTCSGWPHARRADKVLVPEHGSEEISAGMTKLYRRRCFEDIGGLVRGVMWDGIDCHRCRMMGWVAKSWNDSSDLKFVHLRQMGSSEGSILRGRARHGRGQRFMGTGLIYLLASAANQARQRPYLIGSLAMVWGYLAAMVKRQKRLDDPEFIKFLRRFQCHCLLRGKRWAIKRVSEERKLVGISIASSRTQQEPSPELNGQVNEHER